MPMHFEDIAQSATTYSQKVPGGHLYRAAIGSGHDAAAGAVFELRVRLNKDQTPFAVAVWNALTHAYAVSITGPDQYAWADVPGAESVFVVRTDGTGGVGTGGLDLVASSGAQP